jgi:hypothetical protein
MLPLEAPLGRSEFVRAADGYEVARSAGTLPATDAGNEFSLDPTTGVCSAVFQTGGAACLPSTRRIWPEPSQPQVDAREPTGLAFWRWRARAAGRPALNPISHHRCGRRYQRPRYRRRSSHRRTVGIRTLLPLTTNLDRASLAGTAVIEATDIGPSERSVALVFQMRAVPKSCLRDRI